MATGLHFWSNLTLVKASDTYKELLTRNKTRYMEPTIFQASLKIDGIYVASLNPNGGSRQAFLKEYISVLIGES